MSDRHSSPGLKLRASDIEFDNLWESAEAKEAVTIWHRHPGYHWFTRRCRVAEVMQLRQALGQNSERASGVFEGMVMVRRLAELMASEANSRDVDAEGNPLGVAIPDTDPDELHAALLIFMTEFEATKKQEAASG